MINKQKADVVIIGGGIIGCAIAYELSKYQLAVVLLEKEPDIATGTTKANSGILHSGFDPKPDYVKAKTNVRGNELFHQLEKDLQLDIRWTGSLSIARTDEEVEALQELLERGKVNNVPGLEILSKEEVLKREPNLSSDIKAALFAPSAGVISPFKAAISFAECAMQNGVEILREHTVESFDLENNTIKAVNTNKGKIITSYVINASGIVADDISKKAGDDSFTIKPRKGEYLLFDNSVTDKLVKSIIFPMPSKLGKGILVCSTYHEDVFIGPDAQNTDDKDDVSTQTDNMNSIIENARKLVENIPVGSVITEFSGIRAVSDTDDFIVGLSKKTKGLIQAAGIQSPGLTAAPAIAELIAEELQKDGLKLTPKSDFNNKLLKKVKFSELDNEEKNKLIQKNPLYGRIICRCETISEAEIVEAINSPCGARSIDGVKRRVRAGMGRCQGGFCGPRVTAIIARELGIKLTDVIKESANSQMFFEKLTDEEVPKLAK